MKQLLENGLENMPNDYNYFKIKLKSLISK